MNQFAVIDNCLQIGGPGKTEDELTLAITSGVTINMESESEMMRITALAEKLDVIPNVAIRVNSDFELKSSGMKMAGGPKPFGVDAERVPTMLTELAFRLAESAPTAVKWLNIGGGLGVPYFPGEERLQLSAISDNLSQLLEKSRKNLPNSEIVMELGRVAIVGPLCTPLDILADKMSLPRADVGDLVVIFQSGAYGYSASPHSFLSHPPPRECLIEANSKVKVDNT